MREVILPYRPLWLYRFFAFIERLPGPRWLLPFITIVGVGAANQIIAWQRGLLPTGQLDGYLLLVGLYIVMMPAVWVLSSERAQHAILEFYEGSGVSRDRVKAAVSDFNSLPGWEAVLLLAFGCFQGYYLFNNITISMLPISAQVLPALGLLSWLSTNGFIYPVFGRGFRQLALIRRMYSEMEVDIFNRRPIYALSRYASWMSIVALIVAYGLQSITFPSFLLTPVGILLSFLTLILIILIFFIPLIDINRSMREAKERLLSEINRDLKQLQRRVHLSVERKDLAKISDLRTAMGAVRDELEIVQKIPTWPWQADTLRNLFTPLLIPILVYLVQRFLGGMLGL